MRRPLSLLILPVLLLAALALAACGGEDGGAAESSADPRALLERAATTRVDSGVVEASLKANLRGGDLPGGPLSLKFEGPFQSGGENELTQFDWDVTVSGGGISLDGGVIATDDNAFVEFKGETYEVGKELFGQLKSMAGAGGFEARTLKDLGVDPAEWFEDPRAEDGGEVMGTPTTKVTGELDVLAIVDDLVEASRKMTPGEEIDAPTAAERRQLESAVEEARADVHVAGDGTMRRLVLVLKLDVPEDARAELDGLEGGTIEFDVSVGEVGEEQEIEAPDDARPLQELLGQFGLGGTPPGLRQ